MDKRTKSKISNAVCDFIKEIVLIADEENYDRDSLIKEAVDMLGVMVEISTFKHFDVDQA